MEAEDLVFEFVRRRIETAIKEYTDRLDDFVDGQRRWEYYGVQRRIAQAAVNYGGFIVTGTRHFCPIMCMQIDGIGQKYLERFAGENIVQGFTCQYGHFLTREEAYVIAREAGQILDGKDCLPGTLFSECYI